MKAAAALLIALPLVAFVHEFVLVAAAWSLRASFQIDWVQNAVRLVVTDPVHASLVIELAGGIAPQGVAVGGAPGQLLHLLLPALFLEPGLVRPGAWVSAIFAHDSSILSLLLMRMLGEGALIILGGLLVEWGRRGMNWITLLKVGGAHGLASVAMGFLVMGQAVWMLLGSGFFPNEETLRDAGVGFALSTIWQVNASQYEWLMGWFLPLIIPAVIVASALAFSWLLPRALYPFANLSKLPQRQPGSARRTIWDTLVFACALVLLVALSSVTANYFGLARMQLMEVAQLQSAPVVLQETRTYEEHNEKSSAIPFATLAPFTSPTETFWQDGLTATEAHSPRPPRAAVGMVNTPVPSAPTGGAPVSSLQQPDRTAISRRPSFRILVNGQARPWIGMNYNVNYTRLPPEIKMARHRRDFGILRAARVNALIGWGVYDEATLQVAQEYGIGVIMPFDLDPQGAYDNPSYRQRVKSDFVTFVNHFRGFPSVLAWNPGGDELLHRMESDQHRTRDKLAAAADFVVELAAAAYAADPNHISIVKDARESYLPYFEQSLNKMRAGPEHVEPGNFLVYGIDVYGTPTNVAVSLHNAKNNVERRLRLAMIVGEYAPLGLARQARPTNYGLISDTVYAICPNGGFAYVFGPDQPNPQAPNPYDPLRLLVNEFSLVNMDGVPVDDSLKVLTARWSGTR